VFIIFLSLDEVSEIHRDQIERYRGIRGVRDMTLMQSATAMPAAMFGGSYLHKSVFEMAAAYLFHIVRDHPFVDGNKRTGVVAALVFLELNGISIKVSQEALENLVMGVARGELDKAAIAAFLAEAAK